MDNKIKQDEEQFNLLVTKLEDPQWIEYLKYKRVIVNYVITEMNLRSEEEIYKLCEATFKEQSYTDKAFNLILSKIHNNNPINDDTLETLPIFIEKAKEEIGEDFTPDIIPSLEREYYSIIEMTIKEGGTINKEIYDSLTDGMKYHFTKHYNFNYDKIKGSEDMAS